MYFRAITATSAGMVAEKSSVARSFGTSDKDIIDTFLESHVEHFIGLIEDHGFHFTQLDGSSCG
jgi:hypothetical protein